MRKNRRRGWSRKGKGGERRGYRYVWRAAAAVVSVVAGAGQTVFAQVTT